jgi:predicted transposase YbfD/YdcC
MPDITPISDATHLETSLCFSVDSLRAYLEQLCDPRKARGVRYRFVDLLTLLILAKMGGEDTLRGMADWVRLRGADLVRLLKLPRSSLPHQTTYERVLDALDVAAFEQMVGAFFAQQAPTNITVTLDGKTLRGTIPPGETQGTHLLAAYVPQESFVLMQVEVDGKGNEITAAPRLLAVIDLSGRVVTGDAMFTQREVCEQIVAGEGDYVFPVKANQPHLQQAIADAFVPPPITPGHSRPVWEWATAQTVTGGHGRIECRYLTATSQLNDYLDWPQVAQVFRLQRVVHHQKTGQLTYDVVFGLTSLTADQCPPLRLIDLIRHHWHIENRLHYVRDVTFHEDACQIRHPGRQRLLASLNNLVIGLLRRCPFDYIPDARRFFALHFDQAFHLLL